MTCRRTIALDQYSCLNFRLHTPLQKLPPDEIINVKDEMPVDKAIKYKERLRMFSPRQKRNLFTHN